MTVPAGRRAHRGWVRRSWGAAALVALLAAGGLPAGLRALSADPVVARPGDRAGVPTPTATGTPTARAPAAPVRTGGSRELAPVAPQAPVGLRIPALGLAVGLSELGLNPDRTVEVPTDYALPGWFRLGPTPGRPGSAVILGHVDSQRGPAVFFRLGSLRVGDEVAVTLADGTVARFAVREVATYLKREFPARLVYGSHGGRSLQLVTCGGEFDRKARRYLSNVVVHTELADVVPPRR